MEGKVKWRGEERQRRGGKKRERGERGGKEEGCELKGKGKRRKRKKKGKRTAAPDQLCPTMFEPWLRH